jgi:RimJ/RimL family protein N-acetyltransferase
MARTKKAQAEKLQGVGSGNKSLRVTKGLSIRKVELTDIPLLREWYSDEESRHQLYAPPQSETEFAYYMLQPHRFMVMRSSVPVATFRIEEQGSAAVLGILVSPDYRGRGIGTHVLGFAEREAKSLGFNVLSVDIYSDNKAAIKAFSRAGFREFIWYEKNI